MWSPLIRIVIDDTNVCDLQNPLRYKMRQHCVGQNYSVILLSQSTFSVACIPATQMQRNHRTKAIIIFHTAAIVIEGSSITDRVNSFESFSSISLVPSTDPLSVTINRDTPQAAWYLTLASMISASSRTRMDIARRM